MTGPPSDIIVTADMVYFDAALHLAVNETFTEIIQGAMNFRVLADTGWSLVQLVGDRLTVTGVPKNTKTLKLVGDVRTGCDLEEIACPMKSLSTLTTRLPLAFGDFRQTDPCSNVYLFYRSEILQGQKNLTIAVSMESNPMQLEPSKFVVILPLTVILSSLMSLTWVVQQTSSLSSMTRATTSLRSLLVSCRLSTSAKML